MNFLHGPAEQVVNTDLAAALCTLGIPRNAENPLQVLTGEMEQVAFFFENVSPCRTYVTGEMVRAWDDTQFRKLQPRHAMNYMRYGLLSRQRLIDYSRGRTRVAISSRPGGQFEVIHYHGESPARLPSSSAPDASTSPSLQTDDLELAACLLACGIPLFREYPIQRADHRLTFFFHASSPDGAFQTRSLMLAWSDPTWHERHPEHPFAYLSCAMENRRRLMREIRTKTPMIVFLRAGLPQFLTLNADAPTEGKFMKELRKL